MNRISLAVAAGATALCASAGAAALPAVAGAQELELGQTKTPIAAPTCPAGVSSTNCNIVLTEVTALQTISDGTTYPTTVKKPGELVAFTLGLSELSSDKKSQASDITYLDSHYGGTTRAQVTVLRPVGKRAEFGWQVAAQSPAFQLQRYLGQVVQFPLSQPLPVVPGETVALTTSTWVPVLTYDLSTKSFAYRQSRQANCTNAPSALQAQLTIGQQTDYKCDYPGTRVEYSATEITSPTPNAS